ncbi:MAG: hypothetical protein D6763_01865 [Alphaproteobacteria bacterium]|nr:MAG: hypothetical protein D6763_01865 [Alphaproteobacteria bacterium]
MLIGRPLSHFDEATFDFVLGHEGYARRLYLDTRAIPTIGVGYALIMQSGEKLVVRPTLEQDFAGIYSFSRADRQILEKIASALSTGDRVRARALFEGRAPGLLDLVLSPDPLSEGRRLYEAILVDIVGAAIPRDIRDALAHTHELAALTSLAYNAPGLIGHNLKAAIRAGNRPAAWFEIAYRSNRAHNGTRSLGLLRRRMAEAEMFGLYAAGNVPRDSAEAQAVITFLDTHRDEMATYLSSVRRIGPRGTPSGPVFAPHEQAAVIASQAAPARALLDLA